MSRREWKWTDHQLDKLNKVIETLNELDKYRPLTLRQVYYQLVGKGFIENRASEYTMLSNLLKWARIDGKVSWDDIEDRVRAFHDLSGWDSTGSFIMSELENFLIGYRRDLLQSQKKYIELWIEKDALSSIFTRVASGYTIPVVVCRGFASISFLHELQDRLEYHTGKVPVILYFGDFDPSGMEMLESMRITLQNEMNISGIQFKRIALMQDDIERYQLPHKPEALKINDTRAKKHLHKYGEIAVELDALRPDVLEGKIKEAIENELDVPAFNSEVGKHNVEFDKLKRLRQKVTDYTDREVKAWTA